MLKVGPHYCLSLSCCNHCNCNREPKSQKWWDGFHQPCGLGLGLGLGDDDAGEAIGVLVLTDLLLLMLLLMILAVPLMTLPPVAAPRPAARPAMPGIRGDCTRTIILSVLSLCESVCVCFCFPCLIFLSSVYPSIRLSRWHVQMQSKRRYPV